MIKEDKLLALITDEERDILKSAMLKDNLYKGNTYYNEYIKKLQKKYISPFRRWLALIIGVFILISFLILYKLSPQNYKSFIDNQLNELKEISKTYKNGFTTKQADNVKEIPTVSKKPTPKLTYNYGYCLEKECTINVFNRTKRVDEFITLSIKNKNFVLSLKKGDVITLNK